MNEELLVFVSSIAILGIGAQWLAWRLRLPAIIPLLVAGFIAGPLTGWLNPPVIFGDVLMPLVSISVGLILFEGGLSLRLQDVRAIAPALRGVLTIGPIVTWFGTAAAARFILGTTWSIGLLLGAICIVTGPTVIGPLLRQIRPKGNVDALLKWEGILTDPLGASIALLVFEGIQAHDAVGYISVVGVVKTILAGTAIGLGGGWALTQLLRLYWVPDYLQNAVTIMFVVGGLTASNVIQHESGLLTVTLMGIYLANQRAADVHHIIEFKENVRVLIVAALFIVLTASLNPDDLKALPLATAVFLGAMFFLVRPAAVFAATAFSGLQRNEKLFLSWVAPRGIVAASVSAVFGSRLTEAGVEGAHLLAPLTYTIIAATVTVYGLTARPFARRLKLTEPNPTGLLIVSGNRFSRALAKALTTSSRVRVLLADTNYGHVAAARREGLEVYYGNILSEQAEEEIDLSGIGGLLALTSNDEVNSIIALRYGELFGRARVYQLSVPRDAQARRQPVAQRLRGRTLFSSEHGHDRLLDLLRKGGEVRRVELTDEQGFDAFRAEYGARALPLLVVQDGMPRPFTPVDPPKPRAGDTLIALVVPEGMVAMEIAENGDDEE